MQPTPTKAPISATLRAEAPGLFVRMRGIINTLCVTIANVMARDPRHVAFAGLAQLRVQAFLRRLRRILDLVAIGKRPRPHTTRPTPPRAAPPKPRTKFPAKFGWLMAANQHHGAWSMTEIDRFLSDPAVEELVRTIPQAGRLLRPICHMMAVALPDYLKLPAHPRKPRAPKPRKPRAPTRAELKTILWYSNLEGRPMNLLPPKSRRR